MRKLLVTVGVLVIVVGVALGIGDRLAASYAEEQIAKQVSANLASRNITAAPPDVEIVGIPFLTQVMAGNYDEIVLNLRDLRGGVLPLPVLEVHAYDVRASLDGLRDGTEKPVATRMTGTGTLSYADLAKASGLKDVSLGGDGELLQVSGMVPLAGEVKGSARVTVVSGQVHLEVMSLSASNLTAQANKIVNDYRSLLNRSFALPPLPFGLKLENVRPTPGGVIAEVSATEVELG
ncbi:LmeA family phospholipid-binding protein [Catelliglobosispora koreensis]|uniref:LmeA family phospholipid-binding protein n=1 Tax=Catelliglobosispora koreensis TaxID=129052 RepID=UPI00036C7570|nr:DUF2993 domain-containing protein [Catelliglobosispora koreensis]